MPKHNYPKIRKPRDVSYSMSYKLLQLVGEKKLLEIFSQMGMYKAAKFISSEIAQRTSPYVIRYLRRKLLEKNGIY